MEAAETEPTNSNALTAELYKLLDGKGEQGVRLRIMQIKIRDVQLLKTAIDHFDAETKADSSSKGAKILKIIEECGLFTITDPKPISEVATRTAQATRQVANGSWRRGGYVASWDFDEYGELSRPGRRKDDLIGLEEY